MSNLQFPWQLHSKKWVRQKKSLEPVGVTQPITHVCFFLFSPLLSTILSTSPFLPVIHSSLALSFCNNLSLCLYFSVSVASRHRAGVLTCASNTWASLLIRLRSVLREIPSTYTRSHIHTSSHTHTNTHTHTGRLQSPQGLVLVNYSVCVGGSV